MDHSCVQKQTIWRSVDDPPAPADTICGFVHFIRSDGSTGICHRSNLHIEDVERWAKIEEPPNDVVASGDREVLVGGYRGSCVTVSQDSEPYQPLLEKCELLEDQLGDVCELRDLLIEMINAVEILEWGQQKFNNVRGTSWFELRQMIQVQAEGTEVKACRT